jgi:hypothetical protein
LGTGQSAWEEFYSEEGNFAVSFPSIPEEETESINTQVGTINRLSFHLFFRSHFNPNLLF